MPASTDPNLLAKAFDWIKARASRDNEMVAMSRRDLHYLASDLCVTEIDLRDIVPKVTNHGELLDRMMRSLGPDPGVIRRSFPACLRDMEIAFARCRDSRVCRRELDSGTAAQYCYRFCANATAVDDLTGPMA